VKSKEAFPWRRPHMKIVVNKDKCSGHARCNAGGPDVYELDELGYVAFTELDVPVGLERQARDGAAACPERAITLVEAPLQQ
jgi:ferredoxin